MSIIVTPADSLVHEIISIRVFNLQPNSIVRVELRLFNKIGIFRSYGIFQTNAVGNFDLNRDAPIRGSYNGVRGMGLLESVEPTDTIRDGAVCRLSAYDDFRYKLIVMDPAGNSICSKDFIKRLMHPDVQRIEIEEYSPVFKKSNAKRYKVTGVLFKPPGEGPFPTVIDISGAVAGVREQRGAALASRGFCAFSLAFYQYKDLPTTLVEVDTQYFEDAVNYLTSLPFTGKYVGFQGISFGGTLAVFLATKIPQMKAVVSVNGSYVMDEVSRISENGKELPFGKINSDKALYFLNKLTCYEKLVKHLTVPEEANFKLEESNKEAAFRFVSSVDDLMTVPIYSTTLLGNRLRKLKRNVEAHFVPGGHILCIPCFPCQSYAYTAALRGKFLRLGCGGEASLHGKSEFEAWEGTVRFFAKHLGEPKPLRKYYEPTVSKL